MGQQIDKYSLSQQLSMKLGKMMDSQRSTAKDRLKNQGLSYKFKMADLGKYSSTLRYKDINWKLKCSALGKKIPDIKQRKKILMKG